MCQRGESSQTLVTQEQAARQSHKNDGSQPQQGEHSFMNHQLGDYCHVNHDNNNSIAQNTTNKKRVVEDATPPPTSPASTSSAVPHVPIIGAQPRVVD